METNQISHEGKGDKHLILIVYFTKKFTTLSISLWQNALKVGREDTRRVVHAVKVGVALTSVSFLYLLEPLFEGVGENAMWAVITVVVVLEFTAGATLCKGLNRGFGTLCAASLAFLIEFMAEKSGRIFRAVFIGISVFLIGFLATYLRFIPYIKKNYDYGVVIFLLTFNLITVSSFRIHNVLHLARDRLYTIAIGCGLCLLMSLLILPNWSGEDLHRFTVYKLEGLARSIEACVSEYFQEEAKDNKIIEENSFKGYRAVLDSKSTDETLATFASWEPRRHSRHCYRYPWQQYVKLGAVLRHFGYTAVALHGCLESEIQTPRSVRSLFRHPCMQVAGEVSKVLAELASSIRNRRHCSPDVLSKHLHEALQDLNSAIKSQPRLFLGSNNASANTNMLVDCRPDKFASSEVALPSVKTDISSILERRSKRVADKSTESAERKVLRPTLSQIMITSLEFSEALPFAAFASLLVEMVARLELVIEEVEELGRAANFKEFSGEDDIAIELSCKDKCNESDRDMQMHVASQSAES
ncbi:aluminum-activated malate transporter 12 [Elaeis guineensis]|uniref:Aluminum-activated malate transporter 12 n=1 Tax=Elaeis guineensis var. tenera TaxID=51953 RepID=A0A8N4F9M2_ELAGV|nr:aluminum-activated malate transporter 12 [Elaeis guineensis]